MKIGFIGAGAVGVASAFSVFQQGLASEIVLVDLNKSKAHAEAMDMIHAASLTNDCKVSSGEYCDVAGSDIVVISAGVAQKDSSETRLMLAERNFRIFDSIIDELDKYCPNATLVISANPCDILTTYAQDRSCRSAGKILGTGTMLDTVRFRTFLGEMLGVPASTVKGYVLGEHGDSSFINWSGVSIDDEPVDISDKSKELILSRVQRAAYEIIEGKGRTDLAIGMCTAHIIKVLQGKHIEYLPVSVRCCTGEDSTCMSWPTMIIAGSLYPINIELDEDEQARRDNTIKVLRSIY